MWPHQGLIASHWQTQNLQYFTDFLGLIPWWKEEKTWAGLSGRFIPLVPSVLSLHWPRKELLSQVPLCSPLWRSSVSGFCHHTGGPETRWAVSSVPNNCWSRSHPRKAILRGPLLLFNLLFEIHNLIINSHLSKGVGTWNITAFLVKSKCRGLPWWLSA